MMKNSMKSILAILTCGLFFTACVNEEDDIFDKTAAERLNEASEIYSQHLMASPNGWAMQYYPTYSDEAPSGQGFLMLIGFNKDHSAKVSLGYWPYYTSMYNASTGSWTDQLHYSNDFIESTSLWEVITDNGPVLSFNSYNEAVHLFSDPSTSPVGEGIGGDYEFIIVDAPDDASYMMLKGKKHGTYNLLTPVEEGVEYRQYFEEVNAFQKKMFPDDGPTFDIVHFGDSIYKMDSASDGIPNIYPIDGDAAVNQHFNPFLITKRGDDFYLRFRDAFDMNTTNVIQDFRYIPSSDRFQCVENENYYIEGYGVSDFLMEQLNKGHAFYLKRQTGEMSDKMRNLYEKCHDSFKGLSKSYALDSLAFTKNLDNGNYKWSFKYAAGKGATTISYEYTGDLENNVINFAYYQAGQYGDIILDVEGVEELVKDTFGQPFRVESYETSFNLTRLKFIAVNDPDLWFTLKY